MNWKDNNSRKKSIMLSYEQKGGQQQKKIHHASPWIDKHFFTSVSKNPSPDEISSAFTFLWRFFLFYNVFSLFQRFFLFYDAFYSFQHFLFFSIGFYSFQRFLFFTTLFILYNVFYSFQRFLFFLTLFHQSYCNNPLPNSSKYIRLLKIVTENKVFRKKNCSRKRVKKYACEKKG